MHSPLMAPILPELRKAMQAVKRLSCKTRHCHGKNNLTATNSLGVLDLFGLWFLLRVVLLVHWPGPFPDSDPKGPEAKREASAAPE